MPSRITVIFVLSVLGALHAWIGWRLAPALSADGVVQSLCAPYMVLSWFLIPGALLSRNMKSQVWADRLSWVGMLAMGLFSSLLLLTLVRAVLLLVLPWLSGALLREELHTWSAQAVVIG